MAKSKPAGRTLVDVIRGLLPPPVREEQSDGGTLLTAGDPGLVAVRASDAGLEVAMFGIRWDGPHTPTRADRRLCQLPWDELPAELPEQAVVAHALVQAALAIRRTEFRVCTRCGQSTPREWRHGDVCHGCAERDLGVVH